MEIGSTDQVYRLNVKRRLFACASSLEMERQQLQRRSRLGARARVSAQRPKSRGLVNSARVLWGRNYTCEVTDSDAVIRGMTLGSSKRRPRIGHTFWPSADEIDRRGCSPSRSADDAIAIQSSRRRDCMRRCMTAHFLPIGGGLGLIIREIRPLQHKMCAIRCEARMPVLRDICMRLGCQHRRAERIIER